MKCLVMKFGKGDKRISLLHLRKPFGIGIGGMITSPMFEEQIPIVVKKRDDSDDEFNLAYLAVGKGGVLPRIVMSEEKPSAEFRAGVARKWVLRHGGGTYILV